MQGDNSIRAQQLKKMEALYEIDRICKKHSLRFFLDYGSLIGAARHEGYIPWDDDIDLGMPIKDYRKFIKIAKTELSDKFFLQTYKTDKGYFLPFLKIRINNTCDLFIPWKHIKMHHGLSLDIFPVFPLSNIRFLRKLQIKFGILYKISFGGRTLSGSSKGVKTLAKILSVFPKGFIGALLYPFFALSSEKKAKYFSHITEEPRGFFKKETIFPLENIKFEDGFFPAPKDFHTYLTSLYGDYLTPPPEEDRHCHEGFIVDLYNSYEKYI